MKIVIDISEEDYLNLIKTDENGEKEIPLGLLMSLWDCVKYNYTPLPKNHGRLIDADAFIAMLEDATERQRYKELLIDDCLTVDDVIEAIIESLKNEGIAEGDAPTIIPAESEE